MEGHRLKAKVESYIGSPITRLERMRGGASPRQFWKTTLQPPHYFPADELLIMVFPEDYAASLQDYMDVDYYLKRMGISTPRLYEIWQEGKLLFLEFVEAPTLEEWVNARHLSIELALTEALEFLQQIQTACRYETHCPAFGRPMDETFFQFEFDHHFRLHVLERFLGISPSPGEEKALLQFRNTLVRELAVPPSVFVHRDFQSSNLMAYFNGYDRIHFKLIDFQDARYGNPLYDVVSLLWDSYVPIPETLRNQLLEKYYHFQNQLPGGWQSQEQFYRKTYLFAIQRKLHDAGAFSKNFQRVGNGTYKRFILPTLQMVVALLDHFPEFTIIQELLQKRLSEVKA